MTMRKAKLQPLIEEFLLGVANPCTRANFRSDLRVMDRHFDPWTGRESSLEIIKFVRTQERLVSVRTLRERMTRVRRIYAFLVARKIRRDNPVDLSNVPRGKDLRTPKAPTLSEVQSLGEVLDQSTFKGLRDTAMISLMLSEALRIVEVTRLNRSSVQDFNGSLQLEVAGKGGRLENVTVFQHTATVLRRYLKQAKCKGAEPLFYPVRGKIKRLTTRGIRKQVDQYFRQAGIRKGLSAHSMRHFHASLLAHNGAPLTYVQKRLRHSDYRVTLRYFNDINSPTPQYFQPEKLLASAFR